MDTPAHSNWPAIRRWVHSPCGCCGVLTQLAAHLEVKSREGDAAQVHLHVRRKVGRRRDDGGWAGCYGGVWVPNWHPARVEYA